MHLALNHIGPEGTQARPVSDVLRSCHIEGYHRDDDVFSCFLCVDVACLTSVWVLLLCLLFDLLSLEPFSDRFEVSVMLIRRLVQVVQS